MLRRIFHVRCSSRRKEAPSYRTSLQQRNMEFPYVGCYISKGDDRWYGFRICFEFRISNFEFSSRHSAESRVRQHHFQGHQAKRGEQRPLEQRAIRREAPQLNLAFFESIYVVVDAFELATIGGAVEFRL